MPTPANMKVNKISTNFIKPETPTPQNLKNYKISVIDQLTGSMNFAVVLFYESNSENKSQLQESLAKTLVEFYPLAGRYIKNDHAVDCSDQGALFVEAEAVDVELIDLVPNIETDQLNTLLPEPYFRIDEEADKPLLSVQATRFPCGGVAVAVSICHRVFDGASLGTFISAWSAATKLGQTSPLFTPTFDFPSLLPYRDLGPGAAGVSQIVGSQDDKTFVKRFWFKKSALTSLKSKIMANSGETMISRVRVVCAVLAKALIAVDRAKHGKYRDFVIIQGVNMRERAILPQPKHSCGNFLITSLSRRVSASDAKDIGLEELVGLIGDSNKKSIDDCAEMLSPNKDGSDIIINNFENFIGGMSIPDTNVIVLSDWSKFEFYEADFGWGKPIWTSIGPVRPPLNTINLLLSDKEGDGIEAWVHLDQNDMPYFEQDEDIKLFTI